MDDTALLCRTIRRCTAILVATLAAVGVSLQSPGEASYLLILAIIAVVYLVAEFIRVTPTAENTDRSPSTEDER
ncbi:hypothetical protein SAMN05443574_106233 [Haloarcula vallismortis]|uniref:Uncharacterized protein n=2 Tax=Haloarcula vallismortis TaxID=28442 RepID=M0JGV9_HALVA|nr:hypothetical protein [Haloarcula vallismortis]EMA07573.1 hypothetical protein C437_09013 [Haloarcula vallismortis ATCC 29715]SDW77179.1 hypothetical protein SAMN05443574_106233 [Haloarcula vallismortis]